MTGFVDNAAVQGPAQDFRSCRFRLNTSRISGVREFTGGGYTWDNVNHVFDASGTGEPTKITLGVKKPGECTVTLDPYTWENIVQPQVEPIAPGQVKRLFQWQVTKVGAGYTTTSTDQFIDCTSTGCEPVYGKSDDGTAVAYQWKFMPTRTRLNGK